MDSEAQRVGAPDVTRSPEPTSDPVRCALFVAFFPRLVAGPIERAITVNFRLPYAALSPSAWFRSPFSATERGFMGMTRAHPDSTREDVAEFAAEQARRPFEISEQNRAALG